MIKNGHHAAPEAEGAEASHRGAEKRKRIVRVWCDGWCVLSPQKYYKQRQHDDLGSDKIIHLIA